MSTDYNVREFNKYKYGDLDCANLPMHGGGYVNFGYWKNININNKLTKNDRATSSQNLYQEISSYLNILNTDVVLDVGCGRGNGVSYIYKACKPKKIIGIDASESQVQKAKKLINNEGCLDTMEFIHCSAENILLKNNQIDKILSIEALQDFKDPHQFAFQLNRILKQDGQVVIATVFATTACNEHLVNNLKSKTLKRTDTITSITKIFEIFHKHFTISVKSIGKNVFEGYHAYLTQLGLVNKELWSSHFYSSYQNGWIDYYLIKLNKIQQNCI